MTLSDGTGKSGINIKAGTAGSHITSIIQQKDMIEIKKKASHKVENTVRIGKTIVIDANECEAACLHNERDTELNPYNACVNLQKAAQSILE